MAIKDFTTEEECKRCKVLEEWLLIERTKRDYFEQLLLERAGILKKESLQDEPENFPSIHRIATLSSIRKMAQEISRDKGKNSQPIPEAVSKFEEAINKGN